MISPSAPLSQKEEDLLLKWVSESDISLNVARDTISLRDGQPPTVQEVIDYRAKLKFLEGYAMLEEYKRLSVKEDK